MESDDAFAKKCFCHLLSPPQFPLTDPQGYRNTVDTALTSLAKLSRTVLEEGERAARTVKPAQLSTDRDGPLGYLYGLHEINREIVRAVSAARNEILTAQPDGARPSEVLAEAYENVRDLVDSGVTMRTLYQHSARFDEATKSYVRKITAHGAEVRTLDEFFDRLIVIDRAVAFIPVSEDRTVAMKVTEPGVANFLADVFERAWSRAKTFPFLPTNAAQAAKNVIPPLHRSIQRLLVEGNSDRAIARRLGISVRSLQEHIGRIKQNLGAKNRLHLGYLLGLRENGHKITADNCGSPTGTTS